MIFVNLTYSSATSTTRSRKPLGFMRPSSSNSCQALATELWFVQQGMRIQRARRRSSLTALKLWLPPLTCMTTQVLPWVGRTEPVFSGSQSIWFLNAPVMQPCISGELQTWPSDHSLSARSSTTLGWSSIVGSRTGRPVGS